MRPVLVWRIRGASCSSFRWLRNSRKRALPRVVVHSVSILFLLQLTPLPRYGVLQLTAGFTGFLAHKRVFPLVTAQLICADADIPANCRMNGQMAAAIVERLGNPRDGTASSAPPHPDAATVQAGARQALNRPECEYVAPPLPPGAALSTPAKPKYKSIPTAACSLFRFFKLSAKSCPHPNPSPVNGRGARNASGRECTASASNPGPLPPAEERPAMRRPRVHCERKQSWPLSRTRERGWGEGKLLTLSFLFFAFGL